MGRIQPRVQHHEYEYEYKFIIVVAARSAVASPNMSTIGNKVFYRAQGARLSPELRQLRVCISVFTIQLNVYNSRVTESASKNEFFS
jgi:hypothetical protein